MPLLMWKSVQKSEDFYTDTLGGINGIWTTDFIIQIKIINIKMAYSK